jgi:hypothetical protein
VRQQGRPIWALVRKLRVSGNDLRSLGGEALVDILAIGVWNRAGDLRRIDLTPGVNIITGESQTGKSTLIDIIAYCLGHDKPEIPAGPIASTVSYFGLLVKVGETTTFLGRPALEQGQESTARAQLEIGINDFPAADALAPNTNSEAVEDWVGRAIGIEENRFDPPEAASRPPLVASLSHALIHCFQRQDEIASKRLLFHRQGEEFLPQAIKDTLPYFLGVTGPSQLRRAAQLRELRRGLSSLEKDRSEIEAALQGGLQEAVGLLSQAAEAGLVDLDDPPEQLPQALALLATVRDSPVPPAPAQAPGQEFDRLQGERHDLTEQLRQAREQQTLVSAMSKGGDAAAAEGVEQVVRLQQINLISIVEDPTQCPICEQPLESPPPAVTALRTSLEELEGQIASVERDRPGLVTIEGDIANRLGEIRNGLEANRAALEGIVANAEAVDDHQARLDLGAWVRGRIDHFLEKTGDASDARLGELGAQEDLLKTQISDLEVELDPARVRADATSVLIAIGEPMTEIAKQLELEHAESKVRVDLSRLTVVADTHEGSIYMNSRFGSGKNWVGYHLATALSLQQHFVERSRPVPRFLVLDQPSQAFFPTDRPNEEIDDGERRAAFGQIEVIREMVERLDNRLQVIVIEHADFDVDWYQAAVRERWRDGEALIPQTWIDALSQDEADEEPDDEQPEVSEQGG